MEEVIPDHFHVVRQLRVTSLDQFEQAAQELRQAIETTPELKDFKQSLIIDQTSEGLRIQIADQDKVAMFPLGGSQMYPQARELLGKVVLAIAKLPHKISVVGHTDSAPFAQPGEGVAYDRPATPGEARMLRLQARGAQGAGLLIAL